MTTKQATYPPSPSGFQLEEIRTLAPGNHAFVVANRTGDNPKMFKVFYEFRPTSEVSWTRAERDELEEYLPQQLKKYLSEHAEEAAQRG